MTESFSILSLPLSVRNILEVRLSVSCLPLVNRLFLEKKDRDLDKPDLRPDAKTYKRCDGRRVHHQTDSVRNGVSV